METRGKLLGALLALAMALAMAACLLPGTAQKAYADGTHTHTHTHNGITFVEWTDALAQEQWGPGRTAANSLPKAAGNYHLTKDVTLTSRWNTPDGTTNLCLGGKTITGNLSKSADHDSSVVNIEGDSTLNLYDDEGGTGKIVSEEYEYSEEGSNLTVLVRVVDTFNGTFNMYGGTLCATEGNQVYSGVYVNGGSFTLHGGTIQGARASGVDVGSRDGVFTMNGGTITGNGSRQGGGVFVQEDGTFTMTGGSITGNEALATEGKDEDGFPLYIGGQGGGVYVEAGGTFTMTGGSITDNDAQRYGGGVYNAGTFGISGAPEISGNIHTHAPGYQDADNVYLERDKVVNVAGELTNTVPIGITMQAEDVFTSGEASDYKAQFASDSDEFVVAVKGKELMLQHLKHGMSYDASGATVTAECAWPSSCSLPESKVSLTIKAPTLVIYGGAGNASATLEGLADFNEACGMSLAETDIKYYKATKSGSTYTKSGSALPAAPAGAGDYLAEMPVPTAGEGSYVYASVGYTVAKADPIAAAPAASATYGQTLSDVTLANPAGNTPGTWAWADAGTTSVGGVGDHVFKANFTPTDSANYNVEQGVDVTVDVAKADPAVDNPGPLSGTQGDLLESVKLPSVPGGTWSWAEDPGAKLERTGECYFDATFTPDDTDNYTTIAGMAVLVNVAAASTPTPAAKTSIAKAKVSIAKKSYIFDGKAKKPAVKSVTLGDKKLKAGTDYTVKYKGNVKPGTATVTVTGKGNYKDAATAKFTIALAKAKVATAAHPKAKTMDVKWAKVAGAKSYQVQWRERGGKWKTVAVKGTKTTVKGLKTGKFYDFRVRAAAGKSQGAWSAERHRWLVRQAGVAAKSTKSGAVKVTWFKTAKANAGYLVTVRYSSRGANVAMRQVAAGKTGATIKGLAPGKTAYVQVRALRQLGTTTYSGVLTRSAKSIVTVAGKATKAKAQSAATQSAAGALAAASI